MMFSCLLCFMALAVCLSGQLIREYVFDEGQKAQIIDSHNTLRSLEPAANMQELVWDYRLAKTALTHARTCDAFHSNSKSRMHKFYSLIGENIWWSNDKTLRKNLRSPMLEFYDEKKFYFFGQNVCAKGKMCLHYTQFVWATTCAVGCAAVQCSSIRHGQRIPRGHLIVCHYGEGGNEYGSRPYIAGPKCSKCPNGAACTSKGLCPSTCSSRSPSPFYRKFESTATPTTIATTPETTTPTANTTSSCRDQRSSCARLARTGKCLGAQRKFMAQFCGASCGLCNVTTTTEATPHKSNQKVARGEERSCRDLLPTAKCEKQRTLGKCRSPRTISAMMAQCKHTCGYCNYDPTCRDLYRTEECSLLKERGHCGNPRLRRAMNERCAKTCDLCLTRRRV